MLGLLAWIYLGALVTLLAAELNTVRANRLWPRALLAAFAEDITLTRADRRAYTSYVTAQRHTPAQHVHVRFDHEQAEPETEAERTSPRLPPIT